MRKLTAAALVAGTAGFLAWPPSRHWIADVLISTGIHLGTAGRDPGPSAEQRERMHRRFVDELADSLVKRRQEAAGERKPDGRNGKAGDAVI